jgi:ubiquinone/menaquinone biosynthesis C-methylase UbiE
MNEQSNFEKQENINTRFGGAIGGDRLASIRLSMPHHDEMQKLVGNALKNAFRNYPGAEIHVVEIGIGIGYTAKEILEADKRIKLQSVDNEPKMIGEAAKNLEKYISEGRLKIEKRDALQFLRDIAENSMESVASAFTLHNFENSYREKVLKEIFRILKPGGIFINADKYVPDDEKEYKKEYEWQMRQFENAPDSETKQGWIEHYITDNQPNIIMREKESMEIMKRLGFVSIETSSRFHLELLLLARKH